jgi:hypothetical protein
MIVLALAALSVPFVLGDVVQLRMDFYNEIWAPTHLLVHGESPYDTSSLNPGLPPIWFPMAKGLFAPLGWLNETTATYLWFLFNITELLGIMVLALGDSKPPWIAGLTGLFVYFFPPTINHLVLGQFSITAAFSILLAAKFTERRRDWLSAFLLALALTKPQLGFFAAIGLGFFYFDLMRWRGVAAYFTKVFCMALVLSLPLFLVSPAWVTDWLANMQGNPVWAHPSIFIVLSGSWNTLGVGIGLLIGIIVCVYAWKIYKPGTAMQWTLGLTTLISPYIWSWDFVLLLPLWISTFSQTNQRNKIILGFVYLIGWAGMVFSQIKANGNNQAFWWVPLWFVGAIAVITYRQQKQTKGGKKETSQ